MSNNAIFQVLPHNYTGRLNGHGIRSIILTASGGPFLDADLAGFEHITPAQAVKHPNWSIGQENLGRFGYHDEQRFGNLD